MSTSQTVELLPATSAPNVESCRPNLKLHGKPAAARGSRKSSAASSTPSSKSKRSGSMSSADQVKKPRGRPRVEPEDETAADRRRTQIRLAQRAYRLRKETTIASLKERTDHLQSTIDQMYQAFTTLQGRFQGLGMNDVSPEFADEMASTKALFSQLLEASKAEIDEAQERPAGSQMRESDSDESMQVESPTKKVRLDDSLSNDSKSQVGVMSSPEERPTSSGWEAALFASSDQMSGSSSFTFGVHMETDTSDWLSPLPVSASTSTTGEPAMSVGSSPLSGVTGSFSAANVFSSLPLPYSGSQKEISLARRLHRASLEKGLHLIQNLNLRPDVFQKKFQLCLPFGDATEIFERVKDLLHRNATETLNWEDHPVQNLGGSGLHCRRTGKASREDSRVAIGTSVGAEQLAMIMGYMDETLSTGQALDIKGYEGEWLDPEDVQQYLEDRGIMIEPQADSVIITLPVSYNDPSRLEYMRLDEQAASSSSKRLAQQTLRWTERYTQGLSQERQRPRQITVDVTKFVKELVKRGACLGRSPGYRRRDVDRAFNLAVTARVL